MELTGVERAGSGPWSSGFTTVVFDSIFHLLLSGYNVIFRLPLCACVLMRLFTASFLPASEAGCRCSGIYTFTLNCVTLEQADVLKAVLGK